MSRVEKRSAHSLLRIAKNMIRQSQNTSRIMVSRDLQVRISKNQRSHAVPDYVDFSPPEFMKWWITTTGAKRKASNYLLHYFKFKFNVNIPTDYRTLLRTPRKPIPKVITPGSYIHVGLSKALHRLLSEAGSIKSVNILMQFFIDGLSIARSTKDEFWIIMVNIRNVAVQRLIPKVIGVYYGKKKVIDFNDFLWPFVNEVNDILEKGIVFNGVVMKPKILNFVLDAPARTSCKAVKAVTGYFGCDVCTTEGDYIHHRIAFPDLDAPLRNDNDYRARIYDDYHHKESVLELLPIDMIDAFPLDYLHCVLLGVVCWILKFLRDTPMTLSSNDYIEINQRIEQFQKTEPIEFQRKLRSFTDNLGLMKGTEFRQYLLFVGPLLLKGIVDEEKLCNLLKLHIASTIFSHERFANYYNEANTLMRMFIEEFAAIYHPCHCTYVVHSLCHMKKFIDKYGHWDNFSTFEYETYNSTVKNLLKGNVMPLIQVTNRIVEIYNAPHHNIVYKTQNVEISDQKKNGSYANLKFFDLRFRVNQIGQNFVLLKSGQAVKLVSISQNANEVKLIGKPFKDRKSVYDQIDTTRFNIFKSRQEFGEPIMFDVMDIDGKFWELNIDGSNMRAYYPIYVEDGKTFSRA